MRAIEAIDLVASIERVSRIDPMVRSGVVVGLVGLLIDWLIRSVVRRLLPWSRAMS